MPGRTRPIEKFASAVAKCSAEVSPFFLRRMPLLSSYCLPCNLFTFSESHSPLAFLVKICFGYAYEMVEVLSLIYS